MGRRRASQQTENPPSARIIRSRKRRAKQFVRKKEADVKVQLKGMRKELRSAIDSLENRVKWLNIAGMPVAVVLAGFWLAAMKRKRTGAK